MNYKIRTFQRHETISHLLLIWAAWCPSGVYIYNIWLCSTVVNNEMMSGWRRYDNTELFSPFPQPSKRFGHLILITLVVYLPL